MDGLSICTVFKMELPFSVQRYPMQPGFCVDFEIKIKTCCCFFCGLQAFLQAVLMVKLHFVQIFFK